MGSACDIAMEAVIDGLYQKCVHVPQSPLRRETYLRLKRQMEEPEEKNKIQTERLDGRDGIPKQKNRQQGSYGRAHLPGLKPDGAF